MPIRPPTPSPADVTELENRLVRAEHRVAELEAALDAAGEMAWFFANSPDMLAILVVGGGIHRANRSFWRALGYEENAVKPASMRDMVHPEDLGKLHSEVAKLRGGTASTNFELRLCHRDGEWRSVSWACPALDNSDRRLCLVGRDITAQKLDEAALLYKAEHDALTGLANRARFDRSLGQALARRTERRPAVLLVDLDGFKAVNDNYGHAAGDALLAQLAQRFAACQRKEDLVCRIGGDEFAWLVSADHAADLHALAARIIAAASTPVHFGQLALSVSCSIGIAIAGAGDDAMALCKRADKALYAVKRGGKNHFLVAD